MPASGRYTPDPSTGGMVDSQTGLVIRPGDAGWNPAWSATLASERPGSAFDINNRKNLPGFWDLSDVPWWIKALSLGALTGGVASAAGAFGGAAGSATGADVAGANALGGGGVIAGLPGASTGLAASVPATVSAAAPSIAATGGSVIPWGSIIQGGTSLFGSLFGAGQQSSAAEHAADLQSQAAANALAYTKQKDAQDRADFIAAQNANYAQYLAQQARLAPYQQAGAAASQRILQGLGLKASPLPALPPPPSYPTVPNVNQAVPSASSRNPNAASIQDVLTVKMRAPNGQVSDVPLSQRDHYAALGAQVING